MPTRSRPSPSRRSTPRPSSRPAALALTFALAGAAACGGGGGGGATTAPATITPAASAYLTAVLDTMQRHSVNRDKLDWPAIRAAAFAAAGAAQRPADTYAAIDGAVGALGDHHSHFNRPGTFDRAAATPGLFGAAAAPAGGPRFATDPAPTPTNVPSGRLLDARTGYVFVPYFVGTNPVGRADSTLAIVRMLDTLAGPSGPCGWVIDLRLNPGGSFYPMIAGVGPILGDGRAGVFVDPDSVHIYWYHRAGTAGTTGATYDHKLVTVTSPYTLRRAAPPAVAVLYGAHTASSGEATAISFRGLPNARSFGTPTDGLTTGNVGYYFSDGASLTLSAYVEGDRTGRIYGGALVPDVTTGAYTPDPTSAAIDPAEQTAMQWLAAQPACAGTTAARRR